MKSVMRHFDLSSIPLFLNIAATSIDGTKNSALLRKNRKQLGQIRANRMINKILFEDNET